MLPSRNLTQLPLGRKLVDVYREDKRYVDIEQFSMGLDIVRIAAKILIFG